MEDARLQLEPDAIPESSKRRELRDFDANDRGTGPSRMAEGIALHRCAETMLPESSRLEGGSI